MNYNIINSDKNIKHLKSVKTPKNYLWERDSCTQILKAYQSILIWAEAYQGFFEIDNVGYQNPMHAHSSQGTL